MNTKTRRSEHLVFNGLGNTKINSITGILPDKPEMLSGVPETEFFKNLPTVWDETKVLSGEIGKYDSIARRSEKQWFVGAITNTEARKLPLSFDFLPEGQKYKAHLYSDDPKMQTLTKIRIETMTVTSKSVMQPELLPSGGLAIWLELIN